MYNVQWTIIVRLSVRFGLSASENVNASIRSDRADGRTANFNYPLLIIHFLQVLQIGSGEIVFQIIPREIGVENGIDVCANGFFKLERYAVVCGISPLISVIFRHNITSQRVCPNREKICKNDFSL